MFILLLILLFIFQNSLEGFVTYSKCKDVPLGLLMKKIFAKHNITNQDGGDIYIPCGYTHIESELRNISVNNTDSKYIFGISGCDKIVSKNNLWLLLKNKYGREKASMIMPQSYIAYQPSDIELFKKNYRKGDIYILKKNLQRKEGILLSKNYQEIINCHKTGGYKVIQEYKRNTFLVNKRKINLRVYVLVTCNNGMIEAWVHKNGKCIYTNQDYNDSDLDFEKNITSYNLDLSIYDTNPFTLEELKLHLDYMGYDSSKFFSKLDSLIYQMMDASEPSLCKLSGFKNKPKFQLFGIDFLISDKLDPLLLEVNKGPDMVPKNKEDEDLKTLVLEDIFRVIGVIEDNQKADFRKVY